MTTIPDPLKLARDAQSALPLPAIWLGWNTSYTRIRFIRFWTSDAAVAEAQAATGLALTGFYSAEQMRAAIDALPASVPSGEPAAKKPHGCEHLNGQFCGKAGPCLYPQCAPTVPAAPAPAAVPASEPNESLVIGQAQQLIGALIAHRLLHKSMPEPDYINLWDVVKRHLRLVNKEGARTMSAAPAVAAPEPRRWQPIETAPKDGTDIMLSNGAVVAEGHWLHVEGGIREHRDLEGRYIGQDEDEGYDGWIDWFGGMLPEPTHWMPLPAAPTTQEPQHG